MSVEGGKILLRLRTRRRGVDTSVLSVLRPSKQLLLTYRQKGTSSILLKSWASTIDEIHFSRTRTHSLFHLEFKPQN